MRLFLIFVLWISLLGLIFWLFWDADVQYGLPTPIPQGYAAVEPGTFIDLTDHFEVDPEQGLFLHFFNPRCPCSRFNLPHVRTLARTYGDRIHFATVVVDPDSSYTVDDIQQKIGLMLPVSFDVSIAEQCGVYSTPQAVILNASGELHYRGNYNKTRYCTDKKTNYAEHSLQALLEGQEHRPTLAAATSYGCELPKCSRPDF